MIVKYNARKFNLKSDRRLSGALVGVPILHKIYVVGRKVISPGFTEITKWNVNATPDSQLPEFENVKQVPIVEVLFLGDLCNP